MGKDPKAEVEISAHSRGLGAKLREARAKFGSFAGELKKNVFGKDLAEKGFWSKGGAQMIGNLGSSALSSFGSALVSQGKDVLAFDEALTRLRIASGKTPEEMAAFGKSVRAASSEVGLSAADILSGAQAYVALTGDMDGASASAKVWSRVAQATGSTVTDIAQTAAALKQQMGIKPEDMERTFSALAIQGKAGAIELKDLAAQMSSIAPQWAQFAGGKGVEGVKQLGASLQIVKRGFGGDAGETVTGLQSLLTSVVQHSKQLGKGGIQVFTTNAKTGRKEMKGVLDIVNAISDSKLAKNPTKLVKALGRVEAYRAYVQLRDNRDELNKLVDLSGDASVINRDLATYTQSAAGRSKIAWAAAKNQIAESFTPERIEAFTGMIEKLAKVAVGAAAGFSAALTGAERFGGGLARLIYGESEDEKSTRLSNETRDKRVDAQMGISAKDRAAHGTLEKLGIADSSYDERRATASEAIAAQDAQVMMLQAGRRLGGRGPSASVQIPRFSQGELVGFKTQEVSKGRGIKDGYSMAELAALRKMYAASDQGNKAQVVQAIDAQVKAQVKALAAAITTAVAGLKTEVKVGADPIATASKKAPQHSKRPGA